MFKLAILFSLSLASMMLLVGAKDDKATSSVLLRRPTHHSEAPFYDVVLGVLNRATTRTRFSTRTRTRSTTGRPTSSLTTSTSTSTKSSTTTTKPSTSKPATTTRKPTTKPPIVRFKENQVDNQLVTCTHSVDNYHVVLSPTNIAPSIAANVCDQFGWQYAIPPQEDWLKVSWVLSNCTYFSTGVHAFAGHYTGGCQFVQQHGYYLMKLGDEECEDSGQFPILCADTPLKTTTTISSIPFETTTTVVFVTPKVAPQISKPKQVIKRQKQFGDIINGYDVCTANVNGYHMVYDAFEHSSAAQVCADLGWELAEIPYENVSHIISLYDECQPYDVMFHVSSYDGFAGGQCKFAYVVPWPSVWMVVANDAVQCNFFYLPVLCQESPLSVTAISGTMELSTKTITALETVSFATNTVTITMTV